LSTLQRPPAPGTVTAAVFTPSTPVANLFYLAPSLLRSVDSTPRDEVLFLRDEMANMAWAVERLMHGRVEQRVDLDAAARTATGRRGGARRQPPGVPPRHGGARELGAARRATAGGARRQPAPRSCGDAASGRQQRGPQRARRDPQRPAAQALRRGSAARRRARRARLPVHALDRRGDGGVGPVSPERRPRGGGQDPALLPPRDVWGGGRGPGGATRARN